MGLKRSVEPLSEPVTLKEAKSHLRITAPDDDEYITSLIVAARNICENYTLRSLFTQTWVQTLELFKSSGIIELKRGYVQSITSLKYYDDDNIQQTWDASNYRLDNTDEIGKIQAVDGWPSIYTRIDAIEITYICGEADITTIPSSIKAAIKLIIGHLYENRQDVIVGSQVNEMPKSSKSLLNPYIIYHVAK